MASKKSLHSQLLKALVTLFILSLATTFATSARILDEEEVAAPVVAPGGSVSVGTPGVIAAPVAVAAATTAPGGIGAGTPGVVAAPAAGAAATTAPGVIAAPVAVAAATTAPGGNGAGTPGVVAAPAAGAAATIAPGGTGAETPDHTLTFFMHDILGGSNPTALAVTGIVTNPALSGQVPFAKPNGAVLPVNNGVPVNNANSGIINNNNIPFLTGLSGTTPNLVQNNGNNIIGGGFGFPSLNTAQLPSGTTFQKLMFGTMTVFDDELTEGHEHGSGLVGKAQGFYISSSEDGTSQTMAFTVMFTSGSYADSLSFFGVHRTVASESHLAIMGGTGKYVNARGLATVKTFPAALGTQQITDGVETVLEITVYLAY